MASNEYIIDSIKKVARETLPPKSSLLLFGSRARHEEKANSDRDILILLDKPQLTPEDYNFAYPFIVLGWDMNEKINPQVYSTRECEDFSYTPFYMNMI
ncbi:MAG: nucleotidyltransferase domain-containing protein [Prevotella sp.]